MTNAQETMQRATSAHQRYLLKANADDLTSAINGYIETISQNPTETSAYYRLATLLHKNGQITDIKHYERAYFPRPRRF